MYSKEQLNKPLKRKAGMRTLVAVLAITFLLYGSLSLFNAKDVNNPSHNTEKIKIELEKARKDVQTREMAYEEARKELQEAENVFSLIDIENQKNCLAVESYNLRLTEAWDDNRYKDCRNTLKELYGLSEKEIGYYTPDDLFYTFMAGDNPYITQNHDDHVANNGLKAVDIGTGSKSLTQYAPDLYGKEVLDWEVVYCDFPDSLGKCIELKNDTDKFKIGHIREYLVEEGAIVQTGDEIATTGGTESDEGASTGYHAHIEYYTFNESKANAGFNPWNIQEYTFKNTDLHERGVFAKKEVQVASKVSNGNGNVNGKYVLGLGSDDIKPYNSIVYDGYNTPSEILSCIHLEESSRKIHQELTSTTGAQGTMQFMPLTWNHYCSDLNKGVLQDDITCADRYLQANYEIKKDWGKAIWQYNHADWYVDNILQCAEVIRSVR